MRNVQVTYPATSNSFRLLIVTGGQARFEFRSIFPATTSLSLHLGDNATRSNHIHKAIPVQACNCHSTSEPWLPTTTHTPDLFFFFVLSFLSGSGAGNLALPVPRTALAVVFVFSRSACDCWIALNSCITRARVRLENDNIKFATHLLVAPLFAMRVRLLLPSPQ